LNIKRYLLLKRINVRHIQIKRKNVALQLGNAKDIIIDLVLEISFIKNFIDFLHSIKLHNDNERFSY